MDFHYPLVADLVSPEEFEERVEARIRESGGLLDEEAAAMLVIRELGRGHARIGELRTAASLCCLFGRVLSIEEPKPIVRSDGTEGFLGAFTVGDETGHLRCLLWGERAAAVKELEIGDVLEIVGRLSRSGRDEIHVFAMRKAMCEISALPLEGNVPVGEELSDLEVRLLRLNPPREYQRKDGGTAPVQDGLAGDGEGTCRLVCWAPERLSGIQPPCSISLRRVRIRGGPQEREVHLDNRCEVIGIEGEIPIRITPLAGVREGEICSVEGEIMALEEPRAFATKNGGCSWLRRLTLSDTSGSLGMVLWGDLARMPLMKGEQISAYHLVPRRNRKGDLELSAGRDAVVLVRHGVRRRVMMEGVVVPGAAGDRIENGQVSYLADSPLPPAAFLRVEGEAEGQRLHPARWEMLFPDREALLRRLELLLEELRS